MKTRTSFIFSCLLSGWSMLLAILFALIGTPESPYFPESQFLPTLFAVGAFSATFLILALFFAWLMDFDWIDRE